MWGLIATGLAVCVLVIVQLNVDLLRLTSTTVERTLPSVHLPSSMTQASSTLSLSSSAFATGASIPAVFTCDGASSSPPLSIGGVPRGTVSLALIMDDPDVPKQLKPDGMFDHWVLFNIPASTTEIAQGEAPGVPGVNSAGGSAYYGPCPPKQYQPSTHRYFFKLYALDTMLDLRAGSSKAQVEKAMGGHIMAQTELMGRYQRP